MGLTKWVLEFAAPLPKIEDCNSFLFIGPHPDDIEIGAGATAAKPTQYVKTSGYVKKQLESIFDCHLSQFPKGCADASSISLYLKLRSIDFGIRSLKGSAEGFRVLGLTQMHCLPEAGR